MKSHSRRKVLQSLAVLISIFVNIAVANGQGVITGPTTAWANANVTYTLTSDVIYPSSNWQVSNGTIVSSSVSGLTYTAVVQFYGPNGSQTLSFRNGTTTINSVNVSVSCRGMGAPSATFTYANNCGSTIITTSPTGGQWYWQTTSTGTSTDNWAGTPYTVFAPGVYYLRNTLNGCWSTATASSSITITPVPTVAVSANQTICSGQSASFSITNPNGLSGTSFSWTNASVNATGSSNGAGSTINQVLQSANGSSNGTVTYSIVATAANGCSSAPVNAVATVKPIPQITNTVTQLQTEGCTPLMVNFTPSTSVAGTTFAWTSSASGISGNSGTGSGPIINTLVNSGSSVGTVNYSITPSANGCSGTPRNFVATVVPVPTVSVSGPTNLVYGTYTQLTAQSFAAYQWRFNGTDIPGATSQTVRADRAGEYSVGVKHTASATAFCSSSTIRLGNSLATQGAAVNYVSTTRISKAGVTTSASLYTLNPQDLNQTVTYQDGIGRTFQVVGVGQSPLQTDIVNPILYGRNGLPDTSFLAYAASEKKGAFRLNAVRGSGNSYLTSEQFLFYQNQSFVAHDAFPFAKTIYRDAPDARVTEQGAPGSDWQPGSNHTVRKIITLNTSSGDLTVRFWKADGTSNSNYPEKTVTVSIITDENGNQVRTFTNKLGQVVLKQVQENVASWLSTYYIYNNYGQLVYQLPPLAVNLLGAATSVDANAASISQLIYRYTYDARGRLIEQKVPGTVAKFLVYDKLDRLVLTQDGNLRANNQWVFIKYDAFNRPVYTGVYQNTVQITRASVQALLDAIDYSTSPRFETESTNSTYQGYSNTAFPTTGHVTPVLTVNYYDHYDLDRNGTTDFAYDNAHTSGLPAGAQTNTRNLPTASKSLILGTTNWLIKVVFYDQYDRPLQTLSNNHLNLQVQDKASVLYKDLVHIDKTYTTHTGPGGAVHVMQRYEYDPSWRTTSIYHSINGGQEQQLVAYVYNALGQLIDKKLHHTGSGNFMQSVDYRYNIRGWLTSINNACVDTVGSINDDLNDYFGLEIVYNTADPGLSNTPLFNGGISAVKWKGPGVSSGLEDQRSYKYTYDKSDRLKTSVFQAHNGVSWNREVNTLNETLNYDANGNISSLQRNQNLRGLSGITLTSAPQTLDNLTYTYDGSNQNRLTKVEDSGLTAGFSNNVNTATEYTYNTDGALTKDDNKGISSISYNLLGKPTQIAYTNGKSVSYTYDATGNKLKMVMVDSTVSTTTDYVSGYVYLNGSLSFFGSPEGRVVKTGSLFEHQYAIADHKGNTRVVFTSAPPQAKIWKATFEGDANDQTSQFQNVANNVPFGSANNTPGGSRVVRMNQSYRIGPSKSIKVYPGDAVDMEVWAYFESSSGFGTTAAPLTTLITSVASAFGGVSGSPGESGAIYNGVNSALSNFPTGGNQGDSRPAAYLNYILFDADYKAITAGWEPVPASASFNRVKISIPTRKVKHAGYIFVYLSYENESNNFVYFDDFKVTHTRTNLIQYNEYYAFGNPTSSSWTRENSIDNAYLGNGGTEWNKSTALYDLEFRSFDPMLGRMWQVDPMASKYGSLTPYNFAFNDPVGFNDENGADPLYSDLQRIMYGAVMRGGRVMDSGESGGALVSSGSGGNWADPYRSARFNFGLMSTNTFKRFYESELSTEEGRWRIGLGLSSAPTFAELDQTIASAFRTRTHFVGIADGMAGLRVVYEKGQYKGGLDAENQVKMGTYGIIHIALDGIAPTQSLADEDFPGGTLFSDVEYGLNVLWNSSFRDGRVYKENLGFFTPYGLLIAPNQGNKTHSSGYGLHSMRKEVRDGKLFVQFGNQMLQVLGIIHTHPNAGGPQGPTPLNDFQYSYLGIHNYVMSTYTLYDGYRVNGREMVNELGKRNAYNKLPAEFFGLGYQGW